MEAAVAHSLHPTHPSLDFPCSYSILKLKKSRNTLSLTMHFISTLTAIAGLTTVALGSCNHDNCFRAIKQYETTSTAFCKSYLATPTKQAPTPFATCGPSRISSACSCLTSTSTTTTPTSTFITSTCTRSSASACPTAFDPCCQYTCAEAQVPFLLCSPSDTSGQFEVCSKCPSPTPTP